LDVKNDIWLKTFVPLIQKHSVPEQLEEEKRGELPHLCSHKNEH